MSAPVALVGSVARDVQADGTARLGGAPWYGARALRQLGARATLAVRCADADRGLLRPLEALGFPVLRRAAAETPAFAHRYRGEARETELVAPGSAWDGEDAAWADEALGSVRFVHLGALTRADAPAHLVHALARGRTLSLDAQGLARVPEPGPLRLDDRFDRAVLDAVTVLKLAEEEAEALVGSTQPEALASLGVPEVVLTRGSLGALLVVDGRSERIAAEPVPGADPTGAGDAFAAAYLASRAAGLEPADAARRASACVTELLADG